VSSLLQSRERFEQARDFAIATRESMAPSANAENESSFRKSMSFSFMRSFSRASSVSTNNNNTGTGNSAGGTGAAPGVFTATEAKKLQALHEQAVAQETRDSDEEEVIDEDDD
jgi:cobalamin biosynthesis Mg chelatase CobN